MKTKWFYNPDTKLWHHPLGATSDNPPDIVPVLKIEAGEEPGKNPKLKDCGCGKKGNRTSR